MSQGFIHTSESITATNGLTKTAGNITLGGALSTNTTISGSYTLSFTNTSVSIATGIFSTQTTFNFATASTVPYFDASKNLISSAVTPTELGYLSGVTSAIQTQLGNKQPLDADLTSWALITRASGFDTFATTSTSANLRTLLTDENGTGVALFDGATSPTFTTDITTPLIIGGSAVGSQLTLKGTSASGTSTVAAIVGNVGNNGATNAFNVYNSGQFNIGNYASPTNLRIFTVGLDTAYMSFGSLVGATSYGAIYINQATPSSTNFLFASDGSNPAMNGSTSLAFQVANSTKLLFSSTATTFSQGVASSGAVTNFTFTGSANTGQTASTEINRLLLTTSSRQWATGAITTQREVYITSPTYSFVGASTITNAYTLYVAKPTAGSNATITNRIGIGTDGIVEALTFKLTTYNDIVFDHTGIGIIGNQFSTNGGLALASRTSGTAIGFLVGGTAGTEIARIDTNGMTFVDAKNIIFNTTTGTKIGTGTTQKIGFWNATPIVQPTTAVAAATFVANTSGIVDDTATFDGYTIGQVVKALRNTGLLA